MNYRKIVLKVIRNNEISWVHFCYAPEKVCSEFFRVTGCEPSEFGAYLSKWAKEDFKVNLTMSTYEDMVKLQKLVEDRYKYEYSELYSGAEESGLKISGWLKKWLCYHMKLEVLKNG